MVFSSLHVISLTILISTKFGRNVAVNEYLCDSDNSTTTPSCKDAVLTCDDSNSPCTLTCTGSESCSNIEFHCNYNTSCNIECNGADACRYGYIYQESDSSTQMYSNGSLSVLCHGGDNACQDVQIYAFETNIINVTINSGNGMENAKIHQNYGSMMNIKIIDSENGLRDSRIYGGLNSDVNIYSTLSENSLRGSSVNCSQCDELLINMNNSDFGLNDAQIYCPDSLYNGIRVNTNNCYIYTNSNSTGVDTQIYSRNGWDELIISNYDDLLVDTFEGSVLYCNGITDNDVCSITYKNNIYQCIDKTSVCYNITLLPTSFPTLSPIWHSTTMVNTTTQVPISSTSTITSTNMNLIGNNTSTLTLSSTMFNSTKVDKNNTNSNTSQLDSWVIALIVIISLLVVGVIGVFAYSMYKKRKMVDDDGMRSQLIEG